jgi:hypothetical protein
MENIGVKLLRGVVMVGGGVLLIRLIGPKLSAHMDRMFEDAPDDFPPKWMYLNITAIRENTERILEALAHGRTDADTAAA